MKKIIRKFCFITLTAACLLIIFNVNVRAAGTDFSDAFGGPGSLLDDVAGKGGYDPSTSKVSLYYIISDIIQTALSLLGVIFLILMVYGGYIWMTARGEEQKAEKAKDTIRMAIIGLIIVVAAYAISYFVVSKLGAASLTPIQ